MKFERSPGPLIDDIASLQSFLTRHASLKDCTLQDINFKGLDISWQEVHIENTVFLGCQFSPEIEMLLHQKGAYLYSAPRQLPYNPFRHSLYSWQELMRGHPDRSADLDIYEHFSATKFKPGINEALWQRIHDNSIDDALRKLLDFDSQGMTSRKCVGFMGGHSKSRASSAFAKTAITARLLGQNGYFVVSGGGPGIMEATNLGAYFANYSEVELLDAIDILAKAPHYHDEGYFEQALQVIEQYPDGTANLAIPTWFYGHEPSNLFASHIAKYFSNSIREDTLLAISLYGIICAPGSAGTTQEIFMDATQNHYGTFNYYSPMIFLGRHRYEIETMIFPLLKQLSWGRPYHDMLFVTDHPEEVLDFLKQHPPKKVS
jgi:predicted Rossmann-fold nucleotide-binding protein